MTSSRDKPQLLWLAAAGFLGLLASLWLWLQSAPAEPPVPAQVSALPAAELSDLRASSARKSLEEEEPAAGRVSLQPQNLCLLQVVDAGSCKPVAGARLHLMSRQGALLGELRTDSKGEARISLGLEKLHGLVAQHSAYQLRGTVLFPGQVQLQLSPLAFLKVQLASKHQEAMREWLQGLDCELELAFPLSGNPMKGDRLYLEYMIHERFHRRSWPLRGEALQLPRLLEHRGIVHLRARIQQRPRRLLRCLDKSTWITLRAWPQKSQAGTWVLLGEKPRVQNLGRAKVAAGNSEQVVQLSPHLLSPHFLVLHFVPQPGQEGHLLLALTDSRDSPVTVLNWLYEEQAGCATFKLFGLSAKAYVPTLVSLARDRPPWSHEFPAIKVKGRTELVLVPQPGATLELRLLRQKREVAGVPGRQKPEAEAEAPATPPTPSQPIFRQDRNGLIRWVRSFSRKKKKEEEEREPTEPEVFIFDPELLNMPWPTKVGGERNVFTFDRGLAQKSWLAKVDEERKVFTFENVPPGQYLVFARAPGEVSEHRRVHLVAGGQKQVDLHLQPCCRLRLVLDRKSLCTELEIHNLASGESRRLGQQSWTTTLEPRPNQEDRYLLAGKHQLLMLPYGTYRLVAIRGKRRLEKTFRLDSPKLEVDLR